MTLGLRSTEERKKINNRAGISAVRRDEAENRLQHDKARKKVFGTLGSEF